MFLLDLIKEMDIIPENLEKFKALFTENCIIIDRFAFSSSSLDNLAKNLKNWLKSLQTPKKEFPGHNKLSSQKGVYFYDYANSFAVFFRTFLPAKEYFIA